MKETKFLIEDKNQQQPQQDMNFFRGNYAGNKSTDKENYFFSSRAKDDIAKAKPKLLTGRLPAAFNVQGERKKSEGDNAKKLLPTNNSIDQRERYSTEGNVKPQKYKLHYKQKMNLLNKFSSDNSNSETPNCIKQTITNSTRQKTESDIETEKILFQKPIYLRGSSSNSHKIESPGSNIALDVPKDNFQIKTQNHSSDANMLKTHKFLPKMTIEELDNIHINNNNDSNSKGASKNRIIKDIKSKKFALEDGFTYYSTAILKHYFHVPFLQLYILKEVKYDSIIIDQVQQWQNYNRTESNFLHIHHYFINRPQGCITILIEYPFGFSINEIINSTGIASNYLLNKITRNCLKILSLHSKETNSSQDYGVFCQCDVFYNSDGIMKVMPSITTHNDCNSHDLTSLCECKLFLYKLSKTFKVTITQFFSLGFILLRCLAGNIHLRVYELLFHQTNLKLKCCLMHTLLSIEDFYLSADHNVLLLSHFVGILPLNCLQLICELLSFNNSKPNYNNSWLKSVAKPKIALKINELLKIASEDNLKDHYIEQFIHKFNMVFINLGAFVDIHELIEDFKAKRNEIETICKLYDININSFIERIKESVISKNLFQYK